MSTAMLVSGVVMVGLAIFAIVGAFGAVAPEREGVGRSLAVMQALNDAPEQLRASVEVPFVERVLSPLSNRLHALGRRVTPADAREQIRAKLDAAGNPPGWTVERIVNLEGVSLFAGICLSALVVLVLHLGLAIAVVVVVGGVLLGYAAPGLWLHQLVYDRNQQLQRSLPDAIDLLKISMESGLGFDAACAQVARNTTGPIAAEFSRMLQEMQIGKSRAEALRSLSVRCNLPDIREFTSAMVQADAFGIPMANVLKVQSSEIRVKRRQWAEEAAQKVPVKILLPLIFCILPTLFTVVIGPAAIGIIQTFRGLSGG